MLDDIRGISRRTFLRTASHLLFARSRELEKLVDPKFNRRLQQKDIVGRKKGAEVLRIQGSQLNALASDNELCKGPTIDAAVFGCAIATLMGDADSYKEMLEELKDCDRELVADLIQDVKHNDYVKWVKILLGINI